MALIGSRLANLSHMRFDFVQSLARDLALLGCNHRGLRRARRTQLTSRRVHAGVRLATRRIHSRCPWCGINIGDAFKAGSVQPLIRDGMMMWAGDFIWGCGWATTCSSRSRSQTRIVGGRSRSRLRTIITGAAHRVGRLTLALMTVAVPA